jgi:hypothetical protein
MQVMQHALAAPLRFSYGLFVAVMEAAHTCSVVVVSREK